MDCTMLIWKILNRLFIQERNFANFVHAVGLVFGRYFSDLAADLQTKTMFLSQLKTRCLLVSSPSLA